uniref:Uncharacterized protein n=1 Tax=Helianthus annuus TaxID=4232 RepID=A0A251S0K7_HELAN
MKRFKCRLNEKPRCLNSATTNLCTILWFCVDQDEQSQHILISFVVALFDQSKQIKNHQGYPQSIKRRLKKKMQFAKKVEGYPVHPFTHM